MTRRRFVQLPCLAVAKFGQAKPDQNGLAGLLTAAMAVDDASRLLVLDTRTPREVRSAVLRHRELARLGAGVEASRASLRGLLAADARTLAVAAGAILADHALRSLRQAAKAVDWHALDAALLAARCAEVPRLDSGTYAAFLEAVDFRCQIEWHTLDPDESDIHRWLAHVIEWRRLWDDYRAQLASRLAAGARSPLFDPSDPVFRLAERLRRCEAVPRDSLQEAQPTSAYGRGLRAALDGLAAAV